MWMAKVCSLNPFSTILPRKKVKLLSNGMKELKPKFPG